MASKAKELDVSFVQNISEFRKTHKTLRKGKPQIHLFSLQGSPLQMISKYQMSRLFKTMSGIHINVLYHTMLYVTVAEKSERI